MLEAFKSWLSSLPVAWANSLTMALFAVLLVLMWVIFSRQQVFGDAPDQSWWRDLRIWGTLVIFVQLGIYSLFQ